MPYIFGAEMPYASLTKPGQPARTQRAPGMMGRLIKLLLGLVVLALLGLTGYAYLADLSPQSVDVKLPVTLHAD